MLIDNKPIQKSIESDYTFDVGVERQRA